MSTIDKMISYKGKFSEGFTLIELLIVIAILGVLAAGLLTFIDPFEQLARSRDAGRKQTIAQLGKALQSQRLVTGGSVWMAPAGGAWITNLMDAGQIKVLPSAGIGNSTATPYSCIGAPGSGVNSANQINYCYKAANLNGVNNAGDAVVFTRAESKAEREKVGCATNGYLYIVWSSADGGKVGTYCAADTTSPAPGVLGTALQ